MKISEAWIELKKTIKSLIYHGRRLGEVEQKLNLIASQNHGLDLRFNDTQARIEILESRLATLRLDIVNEQKKAELRIMGALSRAAAGRPVIESICPVPMPIDARSVLEEFEVLNPALFPIWRELFENGAKAYAETKIGNCSHNDLEPALLFRDVIDSFAKGTVLDIGCGPYDIPSYLKSFSPQSICGLEPLPLLVKPSYCVERGFGERIPWKDASFDNVVSGAALDHAFSVDKTLAEVKRVLKSNGKFFLWIASIPGAEEFVETKAEYTPIDSFHVFHFDQKWLDLKLDAVFKRLEKFVIHDAQYDHVFYVLENTAP